MKRNEINKISNLNGCIGSLWPHLYCIKEIFDKETKAFIFSFKRPLIIVQYGNQQWIYHDAICIYYRAIKIYEEIALKCQADFTPMARNFFQFQIYPEAQKCKNMLKNFKVSNMFYTIYKNYYGNNWYMAWIKFSIKLILFRKKDPFESCKQ